MMHQAGVRIQVADRFSEILLFAVHRLDISSFAKPLFADLKAHESPGAYTAIDQSVWRG
jgi:hypothetical protein